MLNNNITKSKDSEAKGSSVLKSAIDNLSLISG